jgi:hypothetical protein
MNDHWNTPEEILERFRKMDQIGLDPCSNDCSTVDAKINWSQNGLDRSWVGYGLIFCNPPYSKNHYRQWAEKMLQEAKRDQEIGFIVPANFETRAWQKYLFHCQAICFPDHRISFLDQGKVGESPRFTSVIGYFGHRTQSFILAFQDFGKVVVL